MSKMEIKSLKSQSNIYVPELPKFWVYSPKVVMLFDRIRFEIDADESRSDEYAEFSWFAREFPRYYRHHIDHAEFRIRSIHKIYAHEVEKFENDDNKEAGMFSCSISGHQITYIYWEFEALLNAMSAALDVLSRLCGLEFPEQTPISLNNFSKKKDLMGTATIFREERSDWIDQMKDLRDCFVHYTPIDSIPYLTFYRTPQKWKVYAKLPVNPNIRVADQFRFSRRLDVLKYSIKLFAKLVALDDRIAKYLEELYDRSEFPKRKDNLFNLGQRTRSAKK